MHVLSLKLLAPEKYLVLLIVLPLLVGARANTPIDADTIVRASIDYWRDVSSYSVAHMTIHRPNWERTMTLRVWTKGQKQLEFKRREPVLSVTNGVRLDPGCSMVIWYESAGGQTWRGTWRYPRIGYRRLRGTWVVNIHTARVLFLIEFNRVYST